MSLRLSVSPSLFFVIVSLLLAVFAVLGVSVGSIHIPASHVARALLARVTPFGWLDASDITPSQQAIIWQLRAPRVAVAALVGPNGSGKSTLLRLLGGLWKASEGTVTLDGSNLKSLPRRAIARRLAYTPQDTRLDFAFTVREAVMMGRYPHLGRFEEVC